MRFWAGRAPAAAPSRAPTRVVREWLASPGGVAVASPRDSCNMDTPGRFVAILLRGGVCIGESTSPRLLVSPVEDNCV